ncbi:hypothetical protein P1X15_07260 [Runella sp. MFBS21]|uniref:hypothetical protein n=1 Tax=Runella sp. MFBS21 TaxID=3034018 RepID=UPI0023F75723|nr:hypothetical protein [Runella sp. MFBS21]MDF7817385.1 hypothetical protein [Runella sp. MFBS21]
MNINLTEGLFKKLYESMTEEERTEAIAELGFGVDTEFEVSIKGTMSRGVTMHEFYVNKVVTKEVTMVEGLPAENVVVIHGERQLMPIKEADMQAAMGMIMVAAGG